MVYSYPLRGPNTAWTAKYKVLLFVRMEERSVKNRNILPGMQDVTPPGEFSISLFSVRHKALRESSVPPCDSSTLSYPLYQLPPFPPPHPDPKSRNSLAIILHLSPPFTLNTEARSINMEPNSIHPLYLVLSLLLTTSESILPAIPLKDLHFVPRYKIFKQLPSPHAVKLHLHQPSPSSFTLHILQPCKFLRAFVHLGFVDLAIIELYALTQLALSF